MTSSKGFALSPLGVRATLAAAALLLVGLTGCGGSSSSAQTAGADPPASAQASSAAQAARAKGPKLKVVDSDFGKILTDGRGRALYLFTSDNGSTSSCYGDCATAWPPYVVKSKPVAVEGAKPGLIGTTQRSEGKLQATYAGHPVYYYVGDRSPGEVTCQAAPEFGGIWYVLRSNGRAVH